MSPYQFGKRDNAPVATVEWATPRGLFEALDAREHFTLDAAASATNHKCADYFTEEQNALVQPWSGRVFCNPPYGKLLAAFIYKAAAAVGWPAAPPGRLAAIDAANDSALSVFCLIPVRCDVRWWHDVVMPHFDEVIFFRGRLNFVDTSDAFLPSANTTTSDSAAGGALRSSRLSPTAHGAGKIAPGKRPRKGKIAPFTSCVVVFRRGLARGLVSHCDDQGRPLPHVRGHVTDLDAGVDAGVPANAKVPVTGTQTRDPRSVAPRRSARRKTSSPRQIDAVG
jgi:phage N-6-adenine-methyltransferase